MQSGDDEINRHIASFFSSFNAARALFLALQDSGQSKLDHGDVTEAEYIAAERSLGLGIAGVEMLEKLCGSVTSLHERYESLLSYQSKAIDRAEFAFEYHREYMAGKQADEATQ